MHQAGAGRSERSGVEIKVEFDKSFITQCTGAPPRYQLEPLTYTERAETCVANMLSLYFETEKYDRITLDLT